MKFICSTILALLSICANLYSIPTIVHSEDFNNCATVQWINVSGSNDTDPSSQWFCDGSNGVYSVAGLGGGADDDWLVSPLINLDAYTEEYLQFDYKNISLEPKIQLYYSTDFSGSYTTLDLENASWVEIPLDLYDVAQDAFVDRALPHRSLSLDSIVGDNVFFAFRFSSNGQGDNSEYWQMDNIQITSDYYSSIGNDLMCSKLKGTLNNLIDDHKVIRYTSSFEFDIWTSHYVTDRRLNDAGTQSIVNDRYSENPHGTDPYEFTFGRDKDGGGFSSMEGEYYNREHSFPRSWWGGGDRVNVDTQYTDIHLVVPSDKYVNQRRSNFPFGEVGEVEYTSLNGSKLGISNSIDYSKTVFEPIDEYKGDFARIYFYIAVRYQNLIGDWASLSEFGDAVLDGSSFKVFEDWYLQLMIKWHNNDPVSQVEIDRNDAIYAIQGNRNPFVDRPAYVDDIWNSDCFNLPVELIAFYGQQLNKGHLLEWQTGSEINSEYFSLQHSLDGNIFNEIAKIEAAGNSNQINNYSFHHAKPHIGGNYYRLVQYDYNGEYEIFKTIYLFFDKESEVKIFPNPVRSTLYCNIDVANFPCQLVIKNLMGQVVFNRHSKSYLESVDVSKLEAGIYILELWNGYNRIINEAFIKQD